jgi:threonine aldolase
MIDLRSDTVTRPTAAMRNAMANAVVGDDCYGEDSTVNELENLAAGLLGKEAGLFVPSGTMGNTIGIKVHTQHGDEILCAERSHIVDHELGMAAWFAGCGIRQVPTPNGILTWQQLEPHIRPPRPIFPPTTLISMEHPHNMGGGTLYPLREIERICDEAHERNIKVHMDGSRIFNAVAATGVPPDRIASKADTVMFCLSKGLCAPVGSMLVGTHEAILKARTHRRRLGGAWRQAGVLAAAGIVALMDMPRRLGEDHAKAKMLANGLAQIPDLLLDPTKVEINIVIFDIRNTRLSPQELIAELKSRGVLASNAGGSRVRMVTHFDVSMEDCVAALAVMREVMHAR